MRVFPGTSEVLGRESKLGRWVFFESDSGLFEG